MNSLLQTLYMAPEFRKAVYDFRYDQEKEGPAEECIPYQLQQLFANLQLSCRAFVETKVSLELIKSQKDPITNQMDK